MRIHPLPLCLLVFLLARSAGAQQPDTVSSPRRLKRLSLEQLVNVEVTSVSRRPESLSQAASAIQVITSEDIRRSGASTLPEALRLASNLQVAQIDARTWAISARGFNGSTANKLLVLIDGRIVYTPLYSGVFWDVQNVMLADVERIEVISGPGATLWGANAVNGVINVITKNASDTRGVYASGRGGTQPQGQGAFRVGGQAGSTLDYRIYGTGFARAGTELVATGADAMDSWHLAQGGVRADWHRSPRDEMTLQGDVYGGSGAQLLYEDVSLSGGNVIGRWGHTFSAASSTLLQLYYDRTHRNQPSVGTFNEDLSTYDADFQHHIRLARHDVVWGLGFRFINDSVQNPATFAFIPTHVHREWFSGFAQDEIGLVPNRLQATLGTKIEHNDYTGVEVQPSVRLSWTPRANKIAWAAISRAVREPSRIDREFSAPAQPPYVLIADTNFQSEIEVAYELGYRVRVRDRFDLSLASFYSHYDDLRSLERLNPPSPIILGNLQYGETYGAELVADYRVAPTWRLRLGYTELRLHIFPKPGSTDTTYGGSEHADPDRQIFLRSFLDLPQHLSLDAMARYVSETSVHRVPAYGELDARLSWAPTALVRLSIVGQNLLHAEHAEFGAAATRHQIPRSMYVQVQYGL